MRATAGAIEAGVPRLLTESDQGVIRDRADLVDMTVVDRFGERIGHVEAVVMDATDRELRFVRLASAGILCFAEDRFLLPAETIARVDEDVWIHQSGDTVAYGPAYRSDLSNDREWLVALYDYYGYPPFWEPDSAVDEPAG
jgi:sporulation protein YlmC with PRC-barrel domain